MTGTWLLYGATGYTGRLIARAASDRGMAPVLAGRAPAHVQRVAEELGLSWRAFSLDDPGAIDAGLRDVEVVLNCAGPFSATAEPMISACLRTATHYLDITGELGVFSRAEHYHKQARATGIVLCPGVGFDVIPTDAVAAKLAELLPDACRLELAINPHTTLSPGTAKSIVEGLRIGGLVRTGAGLAAPRPSWPSRQIDFGEGRLRNAMAVPLADLVTAYRTTGISEITTYAAVPVALIWLARWTERLRGLAGLRPVQAALLQLVDVGIRGPDQQLRQRHSVQIWGEARNTSGERVTVTLATPGPYDLTVQGSLATVRQALDNPGEPGMVTPSQLLGTDTVTTLPGCGPFSATRSPAVEQTPGARTVAVHRMIDAPPKQVFDAVTRIDTYARIPWVRRAKIIRPARGEGSMLGAERLIDLGLGGFREEIIDWQPPHQLSYAIRHSWPIPITDQMGTMTFRESSNGTEILWTSTFRIPLPLIGGLLASLARKPVELLFRHVLRHAALHLSARSQPIMPNEG